MVGSAPVVAPVCSQRLLCWILGIVVAHFLVIWYLGLQASDALSQFLPMPGRREVGGPSMRNALGLSWSQAYNASVHVMGFLDPSTTSSTIVSARSQASDGSARIIDLSGHGATHSSTVLSTTSSPSTSASSAANETVLEKNDMSIAPQLVQDIQNSVFSIGGKLAASLCHDVPLCGCYPVYTFATHQKAPYDRVAEEDFCMQNETLMCPSSSYPVQKLFADGTIPYISREEAKPMVAGKRILFIGDSTSRRLMFGLCSFIEKQPYVDRFDAPLFHHTLRCPDNRFERQYPDTNLRSINSSLEIRWSQTWDQAKKVLEDLVKHQEQWDNIYLSFFIHGIADDRYHIRQKPREDAAAVLAGYRQIFGSMALLQALPPISVFTPNLIHGTQNATMRMNTVIKQASQSLMQMQRPGKVSVVDGTSWMAAYEGSNQRHDCLGNHYFQRNRKGHDYPLWSIHLETTYGALLQTQQLLQVIKGNL